MRALLFVVLLAGCAKNPGALCVAGRVTAGVVSAGVRSGEEGDVIVIAPLDVDLQECPLPIDTCVSTVGEFVIADKRISTPEIRIGPCPNP